MIKSCIQFIKFLNFNQKKNLLVLQLSILINSLFEIVGISLIVPFIGLLAVPKKFFDNEIINSLTVSLSSVSFKSSSSENLDKTKLNII